LTAGFGSAVFLQLTRNLRLQNSGFRPESSAPGNRSEDSDLETCVSGRIVGITGQSLPALTLDPGDVSAVRRWSFVSSPSPEVKAKATGPQGLT
jgi:hypothetical protein